MIRSDFTFRYKNVHHQIEKADADGRMPKSRIVIERRLDGTVHYRWKERYLTPSVLPEGPKRPEPKAEEATPPKKSRPLSGAAVRPIPADHPWRRFPVRVGKGRYAPPRPVVASAASPLRPDSPAAVSERATIT